MSHKYEIQVREACPVYSCIKGYLGPDCIEKCINCDEKGFVVEWKDLRTLLQEMIRI